MMIPRSPLALAALAALTLLARPLSLAPAAEPMPARAAVDFLDSMGIGITVYDDARHTDIVVPRLQELGIKHIRTGLRPNSLKDYRGDGVKMNANLKDLGGRGYKVTGIWSCWHTMEQWVAICEELAHADALHQLEGPNEPWNGHENFSWRGKKWPQGPRMFMQDMHAAVRGSEKLKHLPIISFSGTTAAYGSIEEYLDYGNEHIYTDDGAAVTENDALARKIERCRKTNYPTLPLQFTEGGYNSGGEKAGIRPTSPWMQARGVPRLYAEAFRHDLKRFFVYALHVRHDTGFALLETDGTPKPAFHAVRDTVRLLSDETLTEGFVPKPLAVTFEPEVGTVHHLLLQKHNGRYMILLWNDVDGWDEKSKQDIVNDDIPTQITFGKAPQSVTAYRPASDGLKPVAVPAMDRGTLTVGVPDHLLILEVQP